MKEAGCEKKRVKENRRSVNRVKWKRGGKWNKWKIAGNTKELTQIIN